MDLIDKAKAEAGTKDWYPWLFQRIEGGILCTGAVCPLVTRGKRKGEPNYRKADMATKRTVFIAYEEQRNEGN